MANFVLAVKSHKGYDDYYVFQTIMCDEPAPRGIATIEEARQLRDHHNKNFQRWYSGKGKVVILQEVD